MWKRGSSISPLFERFPPFLKRKRVLIPLALILVFLMLDQLGRPKTIIGSFQTGTIDGVGSRGVWFETGAGILGVVPATVFAIGHNDDYIIAKQHPCAQMGTPNKSVTNYFIVPVHVKDKYWIEKEIIGPLTKAVFDQKRKDLHLEHVSFDMVFKDVE